MGETTFAVRPTTRLDSLSHRMATAHIVFRSGRQLFPRIGIAMSDPAIT